MSINLRAAVLAAAAVLCCAASGWAQSAASPSRTLSYETPKPRAEADAIKPDAGRATTAAFSEMAVTTEAKQPVPSVVPGPSGTPSLGESCNTNAWDDNYFYGHRDGAWFAGAEYLLVRPHFSQDVAMLKTTILNPGFPTPSTSVDEAIPFNYGYSSSLRAFVGYRLCDCGDEIVFTYWGYHDRASVPPGTAVVSGSGDIFFAGPNEISPQAGGTLSASGSVNVNTFDIDYAKRIPLGDCDCSCCPRWDMKWWAGVRIADVHERRDRVETSPAGVVSETTDFTVDFRGAGPRMGLEGRRYFGDCGQLSVFARGAGSLLLGQYDSTRTIQTPGTILTIDQSIQNQTRIIPVAELEVGGSYQVNESLLITAGWLFQAWFDLGQTEQFARTFSGFDNQGDANILSFDGLFVRAEYCF